MTTWRPPSLGPLSVRPFASPLDCVCALCRYRSVSLASFADAFGVSKEFIDTELSRFIATGRINAKIDEVQFSLSRARRQTGRLGHVCCAAPLIVPRAELRRRPAPSARCEVGSRHVALMLRGLCVYFACQVSDLVETNRADARNTLYQSAVKKGDELLNRIQKLSRVINI